MGDLDEIPQPAPAIEAIWDVEKHTEGLSLSLPLCVLFKTIKSLQKRSD